MNKVNPLQQVTIVLFLLLMGTASVGYLFVSNVSEKVTNLHMVVEQETQYIDSLIRTLDYFPSSQTTQDFPTVTNASPIAEANSHNKREETLGQIVEKHNNQMEKISSYLTTCIDGNPAELQVDPAHDFSEKTAEELEQALQEAMGTFQVIKATVDNNSSLGQLVLGQNSSVKGIN